mmetsp:Transcript_10707/g.26409  ORF Transcript_10707/g.26409 Transcript_10707/m.26409 type:complete len:387 (-) Transcript_10707:246-1406(-)|eukprot:CAMPEP_0202868718 /NCGR_PEP_ID=MMETSP1391-20130828/11032_1 /ASSEMBLY_ACC=CAM_ASM_000867 /TAXON_ID=1034604 /ORGANISM="Chlamydomonas leiostraca, Strain SAG 11-49" /LENGTH=386 /DNA_ID=CAMNT_0049548917 /DNA_START=30 /DNA_END=1190 /DNA_ORIENTATION=+
MLAVHTGSALGGRACAKSSINATPGITSTNGCLLYPRPQNSNRSHVLGQRGGIHCQAQLHSNIELTVATPEDYWPAADVHCRVFYSEDSSSAKTLQDVGRVWNRVDRILALNINDNLASTGVGRSVTLIAYDSSSGSQSDMSSGSGDEESSTAPSSSPSSPTLFTIPFFSGNRSAADASSSPVSSAAADGSAASSSSSGSSLPPLALELARRLVPPQVQSRVGTTAEQARVVGVANLDSFGDLVPPRSLDAWRDGAVGFYKRDGVAYVSNVAVLPSARRRGLAKALMAQAEHMAAEWGCRAVGLHCNPRNSSAVALYRSLGYKPTPAQEPPWMPYLQGRPPDRCVFYLKRLPAALQQQQQQACVQPATVAAHTVGVGAAAAVGSGR